MSTYKLKELKEAARIILDENEDSTPLNANYEAIALESDDIQASMIYQAIDEVHLNAQTYLLKDVISSTALTLTDGSADMPDDFLRYIRGKCSDWKQSVYEPIDQDSDEYPMQISPWSGVKGNTERPVVAIVPEGSKLKVEVYTTASTTFNLDYIKAYNVKTDGAAPSTADTTEVTLSDRLYRAICYCIAKYYLISIGDTEKANVFAGIVNGLIGAEDTTATTATQ